jgi:hypothetical protein
LSTLLSLVVVGVDGVVAAQVGFAQELHLQ